MLTEQKEDFSLLETLDNGKPITESRADIDVCIAVLDFYAGLADKLDATRTKHVESSDKDFEVREVKEPIGVVGMVTPWNFPLMQAVPKIAPALAAGCTMVLKPSSVCSATTLRLGDLAVAAGLPAGALNIISGTGRVTGAALLDHHLLEHLSFTGSSNIGHEVLHSAAKKLLPSLVELGGKGAIVVFDDADIECAVDWIMVGIFVNAGQTCSATSRLIVQKGIEEKLMARLVEETKKIKMGDPQAEDTQLGSLTSAEQLKIVDGFVTRAVEAGAEVVVGGKPALVNGKGNFYEATILRNCGLDSEAWKEEIFGPVLAVESFSTEEEAVSLANNTQYGLGNGVITKDADRCERVAQQLQAGIVWKNCSNAIPDGASFGGFKKSGFGKEYGTLGLEEYLKTKVIAGCASDFSWEWYIPRKK
jgi:betaine-aldehyde dehydrogenase